uniref:Uncharacterized protein n=1 Tax=Melopsittacus undulatus TaxID=13146 RepID=A0A8C6J3U0_MELUD
MPLCFRNFVPYVLPGVLALLGCWWIYSRRKKHGTYREEQAVAAEEQQEEVTEQDRTAPETEPCVLQRRLSMLEEEHTENKTSTCLLTVGLRVPSNCHTDERLDLSAHLPVTTDEPSSLENDSEKLEETESQDTKSGPACVSLPWESAWLEQPGEEDVSGSVASTVPVCQGEEDTQLEGDELRREKVREVSLCKEDVEKIAQVTIQIVSKVILAATEEVLSGAASDGSTQICQAAASRVQTLLDMAGVSSDQMLAEEAPVAGENVKSDAVVPTSLQAKEQGQNVTHSSCLIRGSSSGPEEGDTKDCWKKNPVCSEGELPAPPGDGSTQLCQAGVSQAETPLEMASAVSTDQTLAEEAPVADTNTAGMNDAVVLTSPQTEEQDQDVTCSSCITQSPTEGATTDCHMKTPVCSKSQGGGRTPVENHKDVVNSGCVMKKAVTQQNTKTGGETSKCDHIIWEIEVPKELVGRLIGRQGKFMSFLRQKSGAKIYVSTKPYFRDSQVCHIEGFPHQVEKVLSLIGMNFKELCLTNIHGVLPPAPLTINSVLMTAWLFLPEGVNVEVVMAHQVDAGHMFLQQHTHPTFHVLRSLDQQMCICYSQPEIPTLPTPVEVGIICAAPGLDGAWLRAQVISYFEETSEVELRYVDYGGYDKVKVDTVRQIRSDFLSLPFQAAEVLLDNVVPLAGNGAPDKYYWLSSCSVSGCRQWASNDCA